jgi:hypothetical protein
LSCTLNYLIEFHCIHPSPSSSDRSATFRHSCITMDLLKYATTTQDAKQTRAFSAQFNLTMRYQHALPCNWAACQIHGEVLRYQVRVSRDDQRKLTWILSCNSQNSFARIAMLSFPSVRPQRS